MKQSGQTHSTAHLNGYYYKPRINKELLAKTKAVLLFFPAVWVQKLTSFAKR